ncbi:MAG: rhodanese-like domain-containing protein [Myxococcales bacterium]|nr:rhodanese-like domain-containing protein [Myxococcales bacterium]
MKPHFSLAIAFALALVLSACGGAQKTATTTAAPSAKTGKDCKGKKGDCKGKKSDCKGGDCADKGGEGTFAMVSGPDLLKQIDAKEKMLILDVNRKARFLKAHVPGAVHVSRHALTRIELGNDKAAKLVFYCGSPKCRASHKAAKTAGEMGYTNVFVMPLGIKGWEAAGLRTEAGGNAQVFQVIKTADVLTKSKGAAQVTIIDVNSPERYAKGHVPGAKNAKADALTAADLPKNKDAVVILYCGALRCGASHRAAQAAAKMGYTNLFVMAAGIKGWEAQGLPTEK